VFWTSLLKPELIVIKKGGGWWAREDEGEKKGSHERIDFMCTWNKKKGV